MRRVGRRASAGVKQVDAWTSEEVAVLLRVAAEHEEFLEGTGVEYAIKAPLWDWLGIRTVIG